MKYTSTITAAFLIAGMALLTGSAAAQSADIETDAQASAQTDTDIMETVQKLQQQVQQLQERVAQLEKQVNASAEAEVDAEAERQGPPEHAQNKGNLGSEVSAEARAGDRKGIMGAISAFLSGKGNDRAAEAVQSDQEKENEDREGIRTDEEIETQEDEERTEAELEGE